MKLKLKRKYKVILYLILIISLIVAIGYELNIGHQNLKTRKITYSKKADMSYSTYLKNNDHYNDIYLKDDYSYVANLIDYFNLDFNYTYVLSEKIDYDLNYEIVANLEIYDSDTTNKPIEKKKYQILDKKKEKGNAQVIKVDLFNQKIDYKMYDDIIQSWKKEISPKAILKVTFKANLKGFSKTLKKEVSDTYTQEFKIPISEKVINISKPNSTNISGILYANQSLSNWIIVIILSTGVILLITLTGFINLLLKINKNKSKYEQRVNKILREFDRAITEAKGRFIKTEGETYIEVSDFMELLDVHDNLNEPIIYYKNSKNTASIFVVRNKSDIYYSIIRRDEYD